MRGGEGKTRAFALLFTAFIGPSQAPAQRIAHRSNSHVRGAEELARTGSPGGGDLADLDSFPSEMRPLIERYSADRSSLNRYFGIESSPEGREADRRARRLAAELSPAYQSRMKQFNEDWLDRLKGIEFNSLNQNGRIDYLLLQNYLNHELRKLNLASRRAREEEPLIEFAPVIIELEEARRKMEPLDPANAARDLDRMAKQVDALREKWDALVQQNGGARGRMEMAGVKRTVANHTATTVEGLRSILKSWFEFYNGYDPEFTWWMDEPYKSADRALASYAKFLRQKLAGIEPSDQNAILGYPIGREALLDELAFEMIPYTPEELIAIAEKEFAWCEGEMKRASRDMGYGDDWRRALEAVKEMHVAPGEQPQTVRKLMDEAVRFIEARNLVTVPELALETVRMEMMSPERQLENPFFTGGELLTVSYPTESMTEDQKLMSMRGNNIPFSRATAFHEMIPGHHLQGLMAARYRAYRRIFSTPFWVEGWALYWELLLWDQGFSRTPAERIGALFWRMHRSARIIFSLRFHLGEMTGEECVDFLVNRVGHERANATAEVRRSFDSSYGPLYQSAYLLGGLQIRALHHELVDSRKMTERAFHDALLRENSIQVELIRADLTSQNLTRVFHSNWRFYDEVPQGAIAPASP